MITTELVLAASAADAKVTQYLRAALTSDLVFPNPFQRHIARWLVDFSDKWGHEPRQGDIDVWISSLNEQQQVGVREAWQRIRMVNTNHLTLEYFATEAIEELRALAATVAKARINTVTSITPEILKQISEEVEAIRPVALSELMSVADYSQWIKPYQEQDTIPTGIQSLDRALNGGYPKELVFVMADSKVGKSMYLNNAGVHAALHGHRVLHITFEVTGPATMHRYYRRISLLDRPTYNADLEHVKGRVAHWVRFAKGSIHVMYMEANTYTVPEVRSVVEAFSHIHGTPTLIILDYVDLIAGEKNSRIPTHERLGTISHDVRAFVTQFDAPVISATQAVRGSGRVERLHMEHMAESHGKIRAAGLVLGLMQTEDEEEVHQGRIGIVAARDSRTGEQIPVYINRDLVYIADLAHPTTQKVMRERGHHPITPAT